MVRKHCLRQLHYTPILSSHTARKASKDDCGEQFVLDFFVRGSPAEFFNRIAED